MANTKKNLLADPLEPCSEPGSIKTSDVWIDTRYLAAANKRAGSIPPALKQQAIDESVPYTDIIEANKQE